MLGISKYITYKLFIMKLQEDSRQWTPFSTTPKCGHGSSINSAVINCLITLANHTNNPGKALPGLNIHAALAWLSPSFYKVVLIFTHNLWPIKIYQLYSCTVFQAIHYMHNLASFSQF